MIMDACPKARSHALVIARDPALLSIADLRAAHVPLLEHMRQVAQAGIRKLREASPAAAPGAATSLDMEEAHVEPPGKFKLGFHARPSQLQLHMHVISQDLAGRRMRKPEHWVAFTTRFFLPLDDVIAQLRRDHGRLVLMSEEEGRRLHAERLRCHGCDQCFDHTSGRGKSLPSEVREHVLACEGVKRLPGL
ncbi:hypothetical protein HYH02_000104 [Chlamydomonas schloesseri]|uniref:Aprataxin C2HE/C2H2/C2HC zinc finger domain-containing protein n=1 Tax=Chlamydomonas schloesseri TaxID=2026947 RepID=A0A835WNQ4_9CHLO|nr:hypothetical protein HYH02_000104 [Chlamydomonas schloesseri]|eukprot:KAG2450000.1 hypothetical protein HYH02_000104 [Chlamydomonas schloesseri]